MSVEADDQSLYMKPMGMAHFGSGGDRHLSLEGASEYYWSMLIERLQR